MACSALDIAVNAIAGAALSALIGGSAYKKGLLTRDGFIASIVVGTLSFLTGWQSFLLLMCFFFTSSALTKWKYKVKHELGAAEHRRGRTWKQAFGAGGVHAICSLLLAVAFLAGAGTRIIDALFLAMVVALAVSNADTWAVEVGVLSKRPPRLLAKPWVIVPPGTSGGVTPRGELAAISGSLTIAVVSTLLYILSRKADLGLWALADISPLRLLVAVFLLGWLGEIIDSLYGSTIQVKYYCPKCRKLTDKEVHRCGTRTRYYGGIRFIKNETVNFLSTATMAIVAAMLVLKGII